MNKELIERMNYNEIRKDLNTFDIVSCEHKNLFWRAIGHTACIINHLCLDIVDVFESTQAGAFGKSGVQLNTASEWFKRYNGRVFVRHIKFNPNVIFISDKKDINNRAIEFIMLTRKMPYPNIRRRSGRLKLILAALDWKVRGKDVLTYKGDDAGVFCTQLIASMYAFCGLTRYDVLTGNLKKSLEFGQEFEPDDVRHIAAKANKGITRNWDYHLRYGITLSEEIEVVK